MQIRKLLVQSSGYRLRVLNDTTLSEEEVISAVVLNADLKYTEETFFPVLRRRRDCISRVGSSYTHVASLQK